MRHPGARYDPEEVTLESKAAASKAAEMQAGYRH